MKEWGLLKINKAQGRVTLQDLGRVGWQHLGVCQSGAADEHAFLWANKLLNNHYNTAALEIMLGQLVCEFTADTVIAITGAKTPAFINHQPIALWQTHRIKAGDTLELKLPSSGLLNYLVVKKGFKVKPVCQSLSQCEREGLGPFNGMPLSVGDYLGLETHVLFNTKTAGFSQINKSVRQDYIPNYNAPLVLPIYPNINKPYTRAISALLNSTYHVSPASNRMGYRLLAQNYSGESSLQNCAAMLSNKTVSAGVSFGCVQLPPNGEPIVLLKDRQTMGGYPMLGCISQKSAFQLAQRRPGQVIAFKMASHRSRLENAKQLQHLRAFFVNASD